MRKVKMSVRSARVLLDYLLGLEFDDPADEEPRSSMMISSLWGALDEAQGEVWSKESESEKIEIEIVP